MRDCCPVSVTAAIAEFQRARTSKKFTDNNKQRDALTTVQNSGKFSPIHNISINAIPILKTALKIKNNYAIIFPTGTEIRPFFRYFRTPKFITRL